MRQPNTQISLEIDYSTKRYIQETAINRFFDNVEKALRGDKECRDNLLGEDLPDARRYYEQLFRQVQDKLNFPIQ